MASHFNSKTTMKKILISYTTKLQLQPTISVTATVFLLKKTFLINRFSIKVSKACILCHYVNLYKMPGSKQGLLTPDRFSNVSELSIDPAHKRSVTVRFRSSSPPARTSRFLSYQKVSLRYIPVQHVKSDLRRWIS